MEADMGLTPQHVAIIMDGNGRWAKARGLPRTEGHREGLKTAKQIVLAAKNQNVKYLSLFTFSTENWKRTSEEVGFLMKLVSKYLLLELPFYREHKIRIVHSGSREKLPLEVIDALDKVLSETAAFQGMTVNLAINYGGRDELVRAIKKAAVANAKILSEGDLKRYLDVPELPEADLIIRTGGERRLSNFLLWQSAYSELYFSDTLWPDWTEDSFIRAIADFRGRERRYGGIT